MPRTETVARISDRPVGPEIRAQPVLSSPFVGGVAWDSPQGLSARPQPDRVAPFQYPAHGLWEDCVASNPLQKPMRGRRKPIIARRGGGRPFGDRRGTSCQVAPDGGDDHVTCQRCMAFTDRLHCIGLPREQQFVSAISGAEQQQHKSSPTPGNAAALLVLKKAQKSPGSRVKPL